MLLTPRTNLSLDYCDLLTETPERTVMLKQTEVKTLRRCLEMCENTPPLIESEEGRGTGWGGWVGGGWDEGGGRLKRREEKELSRRIKQIGMEEDKFTGGWRLGWGGGVGVGGWRGEELKKRRGIEEVIAFSVHARILVEDPTIHSPLAFNLKKRVDISSSTPVHSVDQHQSTVV